MAAMLGTRARVVWARVIGSSGAFAWGDGHEPARELVGWVSGARSVGGDGVGGGAARGKGHGGVGLIRSMRGSLAGGWSLGRQGRAHVDQPTCGVIRGE